MARYFSPVLQQINLRCALACVQVSPSGAFAFVEFSDVMDCTCALALDGIPYMGQPLRIARPKEYRAPFGVSLGKELGKAPGRGVVQRGGQAGMLDVVWVAVQWAGACEAKQGGQGLKGMGENRWISLGLRDVLSRLYSSFRICSSASLWAGAGQALAGGLVASLGATCLG